MSKTKLLLLAALLVLAAALAGCNILGGNEEQQADTAAQDVQQDDIRPSEDEEDGQGEIQDAVALPAGLWGKPVRGEWNGNVWTSEYLGLYFEMPMGWEAASDEEKAAFLGLGVELVFPDRLTDDWWAAQGTVLNDLMAIELVTGSNIQIIIERMPYIDITLDELVVYTAELLPQFGIGANLNVPSRVIAGAEWAGLDAYADFMGFRREMSYFIRLVDGFSWTILVTFGQNPRTIGEYLGLFGHIDHAPLPTWTPHLSIEAATALPALDAPDADHPLIGTWAWDEDEMYEYNFYPGGTGTRGFHALGIIDSFTWEAQDDHLVLRLPIMHESWTFVIDGDVLTIDSRQVPGMTFSYIRR